jgi:hypothetical protein
MAAITFKAFRGEVPRTSQRLQTPNFASVAANLKITSGRIDPLKGLQLVHTSLAESIKTIWRYRYRKPDRSVEDYWFTFPGDTDVVASLIANDTDGRVYYTSEDHEPRMTTRALAVDGPGPYPAAWYALGIPTPTTAPTVGVTGGAVPVGTRSYVYTYVTALGEESGPSPASAIVSGNLSGTWNLTAMQVAPPNSGTVTGAVANSPSAGLVTVTLDTTFGLAEFDTITFAGITGLTDLNGSQRIVSKSGANVVIALETSQVYAAGGTWTRNAPIHTAGMTKRIYRTEGTSAQFLFVAEIPVADTTYADTTAVLSGERIPVADALPPPKNLRCLIHLPNGCLVGLAGNEVCFSTPYQPQSWPISNRYSFVGNGVAIAPAGNSVIVMTELSPILFTGSDPEAMSPSTMDLYAPCLSKRGLVDIGGGCLSPGHDGLWIVSPGRTENLTRKLYREDEWEKVNPSSFIAEFHDGQYYVVHHPVGADRPRMMVIDISEMDSVVEVDERADDLFRNDYDGKLYLLKGLQAFRWDSNDNARYLSEWTSVEVQLDRPRNFSHAQVHARWNEVVPVDNFYIEQNAALIAQGPHAVNGFIAGAHFGALPVAGTYLIRPPVQTERRVQFTLYNDTVPVFTRNVTSSRPFRLPPGYKSEVIRVGLSTSVGAYSVTVAESTDELAQASA